MNNPPAFYSMMQDTFHLIFYTKDKILSDLLLRLITINPDGNYGPRYCSKVNKD